MQITFDDSPSNRLKQPATSGPHNADKASTATNEAAATKLASIAGKLVEPRVACWRAHLLTALLALQLALVGTSEPGNLAAHLSPSGAPATATSKRNVILERPQVAQVPLGFGPGVDLVSLNRRRFELEHGHQSSVPSAPDLHQAEFMEAQFALMPGRLMSVLPEPMSAQLSETLNLETEGMFGGGGGGGGGQPATDEVDDVGLERLTKSCMKVHASSANADQLNVTFLLYTRKNPQTAHVILPQVARHELLGPGSPFLARRPLKWITHGFKTNVDRSDWMTELKNKLLAREDCNVILTDWRRGASPALAFYPRAAANTHVVAKMITSILRRLSDDIELSQVHLIGHSLGAHIMGFVGSAFTEESLYERQHLLTLNPELATNAARTQRMANLLNRHLVGRITACDPALPCFGPTSSAVHQHEPARIDPLGPPHPVAGGGPEVSDWTPSMWTHLRPDSAALVEVIHTNPGMMGYSEPLGDYDFYPNGVGRQPGCSDPHTSKQRRQLSLFNSPAPNHLSRASKFTSALGRIIKPIKDLVLGHTCSHHRSVEYLLDSMGPAATASDAAKQHPFCQMVGYRCDSYASFKRGFCFRCASELDCRTLGMARSALHDTRPLANKFLPAPPPPPPAHLAPPFRRALPLMSHLPQIALDREPRNKYYYDTRAEKNFCAYHYHLLVKYRWFKVADTLELAKMELQGSLGNLTVFAGGPSPSETEPDLIRLSRYGYSSFTSLLVEPQFAGAIRRLLLFAPSLELLRPELIEFVEITYMSHLDAQIRARASARLCWLPAAPSGSPEPSAPPNQAAAFAACSAPLV